MIILLKKITVFRTQSILNNSNQTINICRPSVGKHHKPVYIVVRSHSTTFETLSVTIRIHTNSSIEFTFKPLGYVCLFI